MWLALLIACVFAFVVAGCGSNNDNGSSGSSGSSTTGGGSQVPSGEQIGQGKQGGDVTYLSAGDVDYVDPGQTYYTFGYMVLYATNRPLYSFSPESSTKPVADLADGDPEISSDQKTITIHLKKGVHYSPPVNREVHAQDVKYAIERAFTSNVPSGYSTSYFAEIEGVPANAPIPYSQLKPFKGLQTPDDYTLVIKLTKPVAQRVVGALVMPITVPIPEEYAKPFDEQTPSTYNQNAVFTGPYMIQNDSSGKLTGFDPGKSIKLIRNPNWDKSTDYRPAFLDSITIQEGNDDANVSARRTLDGQKTLCCDSGQLPPAIFKRVLDNQQDQLGKVPSGGTRWVALNTAKPPFDNLNIRKALIAGFDRTALRLTRGGATIGPIAQSWIPPGIPGFEESGGDKGFGEDYFANPSGDMATFKKYMLMARNDDGIKTIDPNTGKWTGPEITMVGDNADPGLSTSTVAQGEFEKLGFKTQFHKVPRDTMYTKFCGVPKNEPNTCPTVGWFKDFTDPESMLEPTFDGKAIKPAGNVNWSQLNDSKINDAMAKASLVSGDQRNQAWADVNHQITDQAPGIPYIWDDAFQIESADMNGVMNGYYTTWDLSFTSVK